MGAKNKGVRGTSGRKKERQRPPRGVTARPPPSLCGSGYIGFREMSETQCSAAPPLTRSRKRRLQQRSRASSGRAPAPAAAPSSSSSSCSSTSSTSKCKTTYRGGRAAGPVENVSDDGLPPPDAPEDAPRDPHTLALPRDLRATGAVRVENATECAFGVRPLAGSVCSAPEQLQAMQAYLRASAPELPLSAGADPTPRSTVAAMKRALGVPSEASIYESAAFQGFIGRMRALQVLDERFLVPGPRDSTELLSNRHIEGVLDQLAREFPDFLHVPFQMIDFLERRTELARLDVVDALRRGYRRFGCVLNTDESSGHGKHWFCLFLDFSRLSDADLEGCLARRHGAQAQDALERLVRWTPACTLEYFNSSGNPARPQVERWCRAQEHALRTRELPGLNLWALQASDLRHQWSHTECGVYALFYIWQRLQGRPFTDFAEIWVTDAQMIHARASFFRPETKR